jgi:hypothetical protein
MYFLSGVSVGVECGCLCYATYQVRRVTGLNCRQAAHYPHCAAISIAGGAETFPAALNRGCTAQDGTWYSCDDRKNC